jgi:hypothetical protein
MPQGDDEGRMIESGKAKGHEINPQNDPKAMLKLKSRCSHQKQCCSALIAIGHSF